MTWDRHPACHYLLWPRNGQRQAGCLSYGFMTGNRNDFRWALAALVFSGAAALGHQLLWTRRMADLIGATGDSNARVLGCYFLGLALGAAVAAIIDRKSVV